MIDHNHFTVVMNGVGYGRSLIAAVAAFNGASHLDLAFRLVSAIWEASVHTL